MITVVLVSAPEAVKGFVSRYLLEVSPSVFVGTCSRRVRESIWSFIEVEIRRGRAVMMWSSPNAQGYEIAAIGLQEREIFELDGITLIRKQLHSETKSEPVGEVVGKSGWSKLSYNRPRRSK